MKNIQQTYEINAPLADVWKALVDKKIIKKWSGDKAVMDDQVGTAFELWGGSIYGKNIEVVLEKKLKQEWFGGDWDKPSIVTFTLKKKGKGTVVELKHTHLPPAEVNNFDDGWKKYYMGPLKELLEQNA